MKGDACNLCHQFSVQQTFQRAVLPPAALLFQRLKEVALVDVILSAIDVVERDDFSRRLD